MRPGQAVLDVACGTGVVAREAADRLAGEGRAVGVDRNEAMLAVARDALRPFTTGDGRLELPIRGHLVTARR